MTTHTQMPLKKIQKLLEEYLQSGYNFKNFCFINGNVDEHTLISWIEKYAPIPDESPFVEVTLCDEPKRAKDMMQPI